MVYTGAKRLVSPAQELGATFCRGAKRLVSPTQEFGEMFYRGYVKDWSTDPAAGAGVPAGRHPRHARARWGA
eukprot:3617552-Pyramimonas_sp.AAC.1